MNNSKQFDGFTTPLPEGAHFPVGGLVSSGVELENRAPLGIYAKLPTPPKKSAGFLDESTGEYVVLGKLSPIEATKEARKIRFKLQDAARDALYLFHGDNTPINKGGYPVYHRTCSCTRINVSSTISIVKSSTNKKSFYSGLSSCASAATCPICAAKINERKSNELRMMANQAEAMNNNLSLLTLTTPHTAADKIEDLLPKISDALSKFWSGAWATRFKNKYGIIGNVRSFEVLHGANGWHPHFHLIVVSDKKLPSTERSEKGYISNEQSDAWIHILNRWKSVSVSAGLGMPNMNGLDIQNGDKAGEYISKFGSDEQILETKSGKKITWDMMDEATKGMTKLGKKGSKTPWALLSDSVDSDLTAEQRKEAKFLFLFYARAIKGKNMLRWSKGLRAHFGLGAQATDEEIIAQEEDKADLLCHILPTEWKQILKLKHRNLVLDLAESGGSSAVAQYLFGLDKFADDFEVFEFGFNARGKSHDEFEEDVINERVKVEVIKSQLPLELDHNTDYLESIVDDVYSIANSKHRKGFFKGLFLDNRISLKQRPLVPYDVDLNN